mmetsp:Transcript_1237/g.4114  ORF Transcript_1237/g.4114 Transcript_1237/m.4114 type:complete len:706 (+) Transcript_1237:242-2359(+)
MSAVTRVGCARPALALCLLVQAALVAPNTAYRQAEAQASMTQREELPEVLFQAALAGDVAAIKASIQGGASPNGVIHDDTDALRVAVRAKSLQSVEALLEMGANPNPREYSPFVEAFSVHAPQEILDALLQGGTRVNNQLLLGAIKYGSVLGVGWLARHGVNVNAEISGNGIKMHVLDHACTSMPGLQTVGALLEAGAVAGLDNALHEALFRGANDAAQLLILRGAKIPEGRLTLHYLAGMGNTDGMELLVNNKLVKEADLEGLWDNEQNNDYLVLGATPLHMAANYGRAELVRVLLAAGANPDTLNSFKSSPIGVAAAHGHAATVSLLVQFGADIEAPFQGFEGVTPLAVALWAGHASVVEILRKAGAKDVRSDLRILTATSPAASAPPNLGKKPAPESPLRNATAVMVKTAKDPNEYEALLWRTRAIAARPWAKDVDHIVFHEASLTAAHRNSIQKRSPLPLTFINVQATFDRAEREVAQARATREPNPLCPAFIVDEKLPGYQAMCWFWFYDFLSHVAGRYSVLLRVDDDCVLLPGKDDGIWLKGDAKVSAPEYAPQETPIGTSGMSAFFSRLGRERYAQGANPADGAEPMNPQFPGAWFSPYSNVMAIDVQWASSSPAMQRVFSAVDRSGCLWSSQWGDLQLWGAAMALLGLPHELTGAVPSYWHGSHARVVERDNRVEVSQMFERLRRLKRSRAAAHTEL